MNEQNEQAGRLERMREAVSDLYARNRQRGHAAWCDRDFDFVCPSKTTYPFQWFWDSCFHAIVLSHLDPVRAESELTSLLANQQPDGLVPHVTFWQREEFEVRLAGCPLARVRRWRQRHSPESGPATRNSRIAPRRDGTPGGRGLTPQLGRQSG